MLPKEASADNTINELRTKTSDSRLSLSALWVRRNEKMIAVAFVLYDIRATLASDLCSTAVLDRHTDGYSRLSYVFRIDASPSNGLRFCSGLIIAMWDARIAVR